MVGNDDGIYNASGQSYSSTYNNVWGNNQNYNTWGGDISNYNDISSDPLFTNINTDNVILQVGSPSLTASECGGQIGAYGTCSVDITLDPPLLNSNTNGISVTLSWSSIENATGYSLFYAPFPFQGSHTIGQIDLGSSTSFAAELWLGAAYYVAVQAYNGDTNSDYSNIELLIISENIQF